MEKLSKEELRQMVNDTTTTYSMSASKLTNMIREISDYQGYSHNYTQNQKLAIKTMSFNIDDECYCVTIYQDKFPSDVLLKNRYTNDKNIDSSNSLLGKIKEMFVDFKDYNTFMIPGLLTNNGLNVASWNGAYQACNIVDKPMGLSDTDLQDMPHWYTIYIHKEGILNIDDNKFTDLYTNIIEPVVTVNNDSSYSSSMVQIMVNNTTYNVTIYNNWLWINGSQTAHNTTLSTDSIQKKLHYIIKYEIESSSDSNLFSFPVQTTFGVNGYMKNKVTKDIINDSINAGLTFAPWISFFF